MPIQQTKDHYKGVVETINFVEDEEMTVCFQLSDFSYQLSVANC